MVIVPFNGPWTVLVLTLAAAGIAAHFLLRRRTLVVRRRWMLGLGLFTLASSVTFHVATLINPPPMGWPLAQNLPLHLCTITSWLMPLTVWYDWKPLRAATFYVGAVAGIGGLLSARPADQGQGVLDPRAFFWVAHEMNAIVPFLLASLALYRPLARHVFTSLGWTAAAGLATVPITVAIRTWVDPGANYFYLFGPEGAGILQVLWDLIPVPVVYAIPLLVIATPVLFAEYGVYRLLTLRWTPSKLA